MNKQTCLTLLVKEAYRKSVINSLKPYIPEMMMVLQEAANGTRLDTVPVIENVVDAYSEFRGLLEAVKEPLSFDSLEHQLLDFSFFFNHFILGDECQKEPVFEENVHFFKTFSRCFRNPKLSSIYFSRLTPENMTDILSSFDLNSQITYRDFRNLLRAPFFFLYIASFKKNIRTEIERLSDLIDQNGFRSPPEELYIKPKPVSIKPKRFKRIIINPEEPFSLESFDGMDPFAYENRLRSRIKRLEEDLAYHSSLFEFGKQIKSFLDFVDRNVDFLGKLERKKPDEAYMFIDELFEKHFVIKWYGPKIEPVKDELANYWRHVRYRSLSRDRLYEERRKMNSLQRPMAYEKVVEITDGIT